MTSFNTINVEKILQDARDLMSQGNYQEASAHYFALFKICGKIKEKHYLRGINCLYKSGYRSLAIKFLKKLVEKNSNFRLLKELKARLEYNEIYLCFIEKNSANFQRDALLIMSYKYIDDYLESYLYYWENKRNIVNVILFANDFESDRETVRKNIYNALRMLDIQFDKHALAALLVQASDKLDHLNLQPEVFRIIKNICVSESNKDSVLLLYDILFWHGFFIIGSWLRGLVIRLNFQKASLEEQISSNFELGNFRHLRNLISNQSIELLEQGYSPVFTGKGSSLGGYFDGKKVLIIGPVASEENEAISFDDYDVLFRFNYIDDDKKSCNATLYSNNYYKMILEKHGEVCNRNLEFYITRSTHTSCLLSDLRSGRSEMLINIPYFFYKSPNAIQCAIFHLIASNAASVKVVNTNFYCDVKLYDSNYGVNGDHINNDLILHDIIWGHDLLANFNFSRFIFEFSPNVTHDYTASRILSKTTEDYVTQLHQIYTCEGRYKFNENDIDYINFLFENNFIEHCLKYLKQGKFTHAYPKIIEYLLKHEMVDEFLYFFEVLGCNLYAQLNVNLKKNIVQILISSDYYLIGVKIIDSIIQDAGVLRSLKEKHVAKIAYKAAKCNVMSCSVRCLKELKKRDSSFYDDYLIMVSYVFLMNFHILEKNWKLDRWSDFGSFLLDWESLISHAEIVGFTKNASNSVLFENIILSYYEHTLMHDMKSSAFENISLYYQKKVGLSFNESSKPFDLPQSDSLDESALSFLTTSLAWSGHFKASLFYRDIYQQKFLSKNKGILSFELINAFEEIGSSLESFCDYDATRSLFRDYLDINRCNIDRRFLNFIKGKRVAVVGPCTWSKYNGQEIDDFDIVVRFNAKAGRSYDTDYSGSRVDINYLNKEFLLASGFYSGEVKPFEPSLESKFTVVKDSSLDTCVRRNSKLRNMFKNDLFMMKSGNAVPNAVLDLLLHDPKELKIFNTNLFCTEKAYDSSYRDGIDSFEKKLPLRNKILPLLGHDLISQFNFMKSMYELGFIKVDLDCKRVLDLDSNNYFDAISNHYGSGRFNFKFNYFK